MMLWDIIRDFFVQYIFGGIDYNGNTYTPILGDLHTYFNGEFDDQYTENATFGLFKLLDAPDGYSYYISLSDWLSTTATIITLIGICVALFFFIRWLFRLTSGLLNSWC